MLNRNIDAKTIHFVWSDPIPLYAGRGGSETMTIGHARELRKRGIDCEIVTVGLGINDGRIYFPKVPFRSLKTINGISDLPGKVVYISRPHNVRTKQPASTILHTPPPSVYTKKYYKDALKSQTFITHSKFTRNLWANYLDINENLIKIVYPFASDEFGRVNRKRHSQKSMKVLFAGRLSTEKGVFLFLEAMQHDFLSKGYIFSITTAGNQTANGRAIERLVRIYPRLRVVKSRITVNGMAKLLASQDIVVMPSNGFFWNEGFGMLSVEAQHAGCRVVGSRAGGLPETQCGGLSMFTPGDSMDFAKKIQSAAKLGTMPFEKRNEIIKKFRLKDSADSLLKVIKYYS